MVHMVVKRAHCSSYRSVLLALLAVTALGCSANAGAGCTLPPVSDEYRATDNTALFTLPDSGGFVVNGVSIERARIGPLLRETFAQRSSEVRAVFVWRPGPSRCADLRYIAEQAKAAGGAAYDAEASGWPREEPPDL
ncbi:MAG TPA: hypothetical protein VFK13_13155 [Gemmatimonadaceae bacterium]|nr:hypothetical protein [Gemmatimonadaceae bacterium]